MAKGKTDYKLLARTFRVFGDQNRLRILAALRQGELNVTELCTKLKLRQPAVSHHLGILRYGGMVDSRRDGKQVFYRLKRPLAAMRKLLRDFI